MKKILTSIFLVSILISCDESNPYLDKIKERVNQDAMGVDINYRSLSFKWVDTLTVGKQIEKIKSEYEDGINTILRINYFSKEVLNKEELQRLRGFEDRVRNVPEGYKSYEDFAFKNRDASSFISELCIQYEETDKILSDWDNFKDDLSIVRIATWYYEREDDFNGVTRFDWNNIKNLIKSLEVLKVQIETLSVKDSNEVIEYKSFNKYSINNPILNGDEIEVSKYFIFNNKFEIIRTE